MACCLAHTPSAAGVGSSACTAPGAAATGCSAEGSRAPASRKASASNVSHKRDERAVRSARQQLL
eukprot:3441579-Prymnesium_polylepis.1